MTPQFYFNPPQKWKDSIEHFHTLPNEQVYCLPDAVVQGKRWGAGSNNYLVHQVQQVQGITASVVSIQVHEFSVVTISSATSCCLLQYTLAGQSFARLSGYGMLPLFYNTYSLLYLANGTHQLLLAPGTHHYLYVIPGALLPFFSQNNGTTNQMLERFSNFHTDSFLAAHLPVSVAVKGVLLNLLHPNGNSATVAHRLRSMVNDLIYQFHKQTISSDLPVQSDELRAALAVLAATHLRLPVPQLIHRLCAAFYLQPATLRQHWLRYSGSSPKNSFRQMRLYMALYLLVVEKLSVTYTAHNLGFVHTTHFSAQFIKQYGINPSAATKLVAQ
ncbi:helix-turn-helix domain-containing protein [Niabella sp. CJ426]|uniref:helix-turn-helix domain-containing protein n=1 Tax=Niabella sp. CJ426 TaxID=3393740 RepID=UPI003CFE84E5